MIRAQPKTERLCRGWLKPHRTSLIRINRASLISEVPVQSPKDSTRNIILFWLQLLRFIFGLFQRFAVDWHVNVIQCVLHHLFGKGACAQQLSLWLHCCIYSPNQLVVLSCHVSMTFARSPLHTSVTCAWCIVRCQSQRLARHRTQETRWQRGEDVGRQTKHWRKNTLKHGCRASKTRISKHARWVDRRQPVRYADKQRSLSAIRQILLPERQTDKTVRNSCILQGRVCSIILCLTQM